MKTVLIVISLITAVLLAPFAVEKVNSMIPIPQYLSSEDQNLSFEPQVLPPADESLSIILPKTVDVKKTITLEEQNTVTFRGPVTPDSVGDIMRKLQQISRRISKNTPIYLVLDTPGGSIFDGLDLIDFAKALPQRVHTVTLFAASMGFQIAQGLDTRYIIRNGTLMSHRATVSQMGGQIKGEFESRYRMIRRAVDYLDVVASKRMGISLEKYEGMIFNEYWVHGYDAVGDKAADEEVLVKCGASLNGTYTSSFRTFFGPVNVTFSKCPLIKAPEKVDFSSVQPDQLEETKRIMDLVLENKKEFVKEFVITNKVNEIFK